MAKRDLSKLERNSAAIPPENSPVYEEQRAKVESLFRYEHLQNAELKAVSKHFYDLAMTLVFDLPPSAELTLALRSLWEAKNLAVFAKVEAAEKENA